SDAPKTAGEGPVDCTGRPYRVGDRFRFSSGYPSESVVSSIKDGRVWHLRDGQETHAMGDDAIGRIRSPPLADAPASAARPDPIPVTPLTFALCSRCGERQPGAECMQPACVAVRKQVAARKAEEATRGKIAALANVVSLAVEQWPG